MKNSLDKPETITEYIAQFPPEIQDRLAAIRKLIHELVPEAVEVISYEMAALKYRKKILVYFAAFKNHIGYYATPHTNSAFGEELLHYKVGKGSIQFPHNEPLPLELIARLTLFKANLIDVKVNTEKTLTKSNSLKNIDSNP